MSNHLLTVIKIHLILEKVGAFSALEATNKGCITGCDPDSIGGVSGCSGKMIVEETFKRGDIE